MAYYKAYIDRPQYGGGLTQYKIETPTAIYTFTDRARYNSMIEYLENGLKVIRKDQRNTYFNNGARLIDTTLKEGAIIRDLQRIRNEMLKNGYSVELMTECNNLIILFKAFYT